MSGGIIINRSKVLLTAANDPSMYTNLPQQCKDRVDDIAAKDPGCWTQADCEALVAILGVAVYC